MSLLKPVFFSPYVVLVLLSITFIFPGTTLAQKAPEFNLTSNQGKIVLSRLRNNVIYLDFWASWCKPCRKSFTFMNDLHARYAKQGLVVIAINLDENKQDAELFLQKYPANFVIAYDKEGDTPKQYGLTVMPSSWIIDKQGNIIRQETGFKEAEQDTIEKVIQQALAK